MHVIDLKTKTTPTFIENDAEIDQIDLIYDYDGIFSENNSPKMMVVEYSGVTNTNKIYDINQQQVVLEYSSDFEFNSARIFNDNQIVWVSYGDDRNSFNPDTHIIYKLAEPSTEIARSRNLNIQNSFPPYFITDDFYHGTNDLWNAERMLKLVNLGENIKDTLYITPTQQLAVYHNNGNGYLIDLIWLEVMVEKHSKGNNRELSKIERLVTLACDYPLENGLPLASEEKLLLFLEEIGVQRKACKG
jgi:hypothetical protein